MVRALRLHRKGDRFDPCTAHQICRRQICAEEYMDCDPMEQSILTRGIKIHKMSKWVLYIVECKDGSLYTGITTDLKKRIKRHNEGRATKYTRRKKPVKLVYSEVCDNESTARTKEIEIKKLSRKDKLKLVTI